MTNAKSLVTQHQCCLCSSSLNAPLPRNNDNSKPTNNQLNDKSQRYSSDVTSTLLRTSFRSSSFKNSWSLRNEDNFKNHSETVDENDRLPGSRDSTASADRLHPQVGDSTMKVTTQQWPGQVRGIEAESSVRAVSIGCIEEFRHLSRLVKFYRWSSIVPHCSFVWTPARLKHVDNARRPVGHL